MRSARNRPLAAGICIEELDVALDCWINHLPLVAQIVDPDRLDLAGGRMRQRVADVGLGRFGEHLRRARIDVDGDERRLVAAAAVESIKRCARDIEADKSGRQRVLGGDPGERRHLAGGIALEYFQAASRSLLRGHAQCQAVVGHEIDVPVLVLEQQRLLAGLQIVAVHIVILGVAIVDADQNFIGPGHARGDNLPLDLARRRDDRILRHCDVDNVDAPVFVAALVLRVDELLAVLGPEEPADSPLFVGGNRLGSADVVTRRDENVEHAVARSDVRNVPAVGADRRQRPRRVAKDVLARDKSVLFRSLHGERKRRRRGSQVRGSIFFSPETPAPPPPDPDAPRRPLDSSGAYRPG